MDLLRLQKAARRGKLRPNKCARWTPALSLAMLPCV